ncbi:MAG: hypothetical protein ABR991_09635 [Terracidiphilus sp.]
MTSIFRCTLILLLCWPRLAFAQSFSESLAKSLTVHAAFDPNTYKPLTGRERWERWVSEDGRSASIHVESLGTAFYNQTFDVPAAWTRSGGGLARRIGSSYGSNLIQNTMHESMAGLAGTDPRYFPCACTGLFRRGGHVFKMSFLTYTSNGHLTLDNPGDVVSEPLHGSGSGRTVRSHRSRLHRRRASGAGVRSGAETLLSSSLVRQESGIR